eukprot:9446944-Karenia_brevis.AAC.1
MDSKLVVQHLNGRWACRNLELRPLYEEGLRLLTALRQHSLVQSFELEHIYREFNADADSLANEAIDKYQEQAGASRVVVEHNWRQMNISASVRASLLHHDGHGIDHEGNHDMR